MESDFLKEKLIIAFSSLYQNSQSRFKHCYHSIQSENDNDHFAPEMAKHEMMFDNTACILLVGFSMILRT